MTIKVTWFDHEREPQCPPDPAYPEGRDVVLSATPSLRAISETGLQKRKRALGCKVELPYPAARCGMYLLVCDKCGFSAGITTAGRPDDPKSVVLPCKLN